MTPVSGTRRTAGDPIGSGSACVVASSHLTGAEEVMSCTERHTSVQLVTPDPLVAFIIGWLRLLYAYCMPTVCLLYAYCGSDCLEPQPKASPGAVRRARDPSRRGRTMWRRALSAVWEARLGT